MGADDLRLNSLEQFTKKSNRFVLEEHSHCEIPAGCGGVVLRWIDLEAGLPVLFDFFHPRPAVLAIDGNVVTTSQVLLSPGRHVLSIEFSNGADIGEGLLILTGRLKIAAPGFQSELVVRSIADGSWLFTTAPPPVAWATTPELPLTGPRPEGLIPGSAITPADRTPGWYSFRRATEHGGEPVALSRSVPSGPLYLRTVFTVPRVSR